MIHIAANRGQFDVVKWLLEAFPGRSTSTNGNIAFTLIKHPGCMDILVHLYNVRNMENLDLDFLKRDKESRLSETLLHVAVKMDKPEVVKWLLERFPQLWNDDRDTRNNSEERLLYSEDIFNRASMNGKLEVLEAVHDACGGLDGIVPRGVERESLLKACTLKKHSPRLLDLILNALPGPWQLDEHFFEGNLLHLASIKGNLALLKHVYEKYSSQVDFFEKTYLFRRDTIWTLALEYKHLYIVKWLFQTFNESKSGGPRWRLSAKDREYGMNVCHLAAQVGDLDLLQHLRRSHRSSFATCFLDLDHKGWTGTHHAVSEGHNHILKWLMLVESSSIWNPLPHKFQCKCRPTVVEVATKVSNHKALKMLKDKGADMEKFGQGYCNLPKKCQARLQHQRRRKYRHGF